MADEPVLREISCTKAKHLVDENAGNEHFTIIDFRCYQCYLPAHLPGAVCYDDSQESIDIWLSKFDRNNIYLVYCSADQSSYEGLLRMKKLRFTTVYRMKEGIRRWKELGYETRSRT